MIRQSVPADALEFAPMVREEDEREVRSISGLSPVEALAQGILHSEDCITAYGKRGSITLMAGVVPAIDGGAVWMLSAPDIKENARGLLESGPPWIEAMTRKYGTLSNVVDDRNTVHKRLIEYMGFAFEAPIDNYGVEMIRVSPFKRTANV